MNKFWAKCIIQISTPANQINIISIGYKSKVQVTKLPLRKISKVKKRRVDARKQIYERQRKATYCRTTIFFPLNKD